MTFLNQYSVILGISLVLAIVTAIVKLIQKQKGAVIFFNVISALISGTLLYSVIVISYFIASGGEKTLFNEPISTYYALIGIAGVILFFAAIYSLIEIWRNKEGVLGWIKKEE